MLSDQERKELEELKKDPNVKAAMRDLSKRNNVDPEKKKLYQYRWLKKKGQMLMQQNS